MIFHKAKKFVDQIFQKTEADTNLSTVLSKFFNYNISSSKKGKVEIDVVVQDGRSLPKSSAFIRLIAPLTKPLISDSISLNICENISELRNDTQIVIIQRAVLVSLKEARTLVEFVKANDIKLVVDTDDAFFSLEKNHPNYEELHNRHDALLYLIKNADQLWVSTDNLKKYYQKICKTPTYVIANTLDQRIWNKDNSKELPVRSPLRLLYMGTATHKEDFQMIIPWLDKLYRNYPNSFELHVVGVAKELPKREWIKPIKRDSGTVIYPNFVRWIQSEGPFDIGLAPLVDSKFNKYKSDIKCLDYLAIGAVPMVSKVDPYSTKELEKFIYINSNKEETWLQPLEAIMLDLVKFRQKRLEMLRQGQNYIWQKRSAEITAKQIADLLGIN